MIAIVRNVRAQIVATIAMRVMLCCALLLMAITPSYAQLPAGWAGLDIGGGTAGSNSYSAGVYTITGSGTGIGSASDQMHFTYYTLPSGGNFRLTARIASFNGTAKSQVGLTVRQGTGSTGTIGGVAYEPASGSGNSPNRFEVFNRNTQAGAYYAWADPYENSAMAAPCYLQLVRYGNCFAVYKSSDGIFWAQVHDESGGAFPITGAIQVGFYVSTGGTGSATATIDSVNLDTAPTLAYESSWIGNTFASDYTEYISSSATSMWVGPDGTCYVVGAWDEGGECGKSYKNGAVVNEYTLNPGGFTHEGGIASDGTHLYYYAGLNTSTVGLYQTTMTGSEYGTNSLRLYTQTPLVNPTTGLTEMAGLAYANNELYVSDAYTGQILVVNPAQTSYGLVPGTIDTTVTSTIDVTGVTNPAPQGVYQTAFQTNNLQMAIPGFTPGQTYTVRLHFAELTTTDNAVGKRIMDFTVGSTKQTTDIFASTGAIDKALAVVYNSIAPDASGNIHVYGAAHPGSVDGWVIINGIEILSSTGSVIQQINCGGGTVGTWGTTQQEIPGRAFSFTRPGPMAADSAGQLWIVQEGTNFPAAYNYTYLYPAAIKLYDKNGNYQNKEITDVVSPTAVCYDSATDQLLVTENGPAQNIRVYDLYTGTSTQPTLNKTIGVSGGVFAGSTPGLLYDPASGGNARFFGPSGVGVDSGGNIYVSCDPGENQSDIRSFKSDGVTLNWKVQALEMTNVGDFDPTVYAGDVWTTTHHYAMNWNNTTPGSEWSLKSYTANPFAYTFPSNLTGGNAVYRKIGGVPLLFTAGQGNLGPIYVYRFVGEQQVPCGSFTDTGSAIKVWTDEDGDGIQEASEVATVSTHSGAFLESFSVDSGGNIWMAMGGGIGGNSPNVQKFSFHGFNGVGAPTYLTTLSYVACPAPFNTAWGNHARCQYVGGASDTMYLMGETIPGATDENYGGTLACFDHWTSSPVQRFSIVLPTPATNPNFLNGAPPYTDGNGFLYMAMCVANGVAFVSDLWGTIHVVDPTGHLVTNIVPGPEVNGGNDWEDENMGIRASYNSSKDEYDILQEMSGFHGRQSFYRINTLGPFLTSMDINTTGGSASLTNGVFTVNGNGTGVGSSADSFQWDYQYFPGDSTIVARVASITNSTGNEQAGVVIRNDMTAGATNVGLLMSSSSTTGATLETRVTASGTPTTVSHTGLTAPYWVKLVRAGNSFTGYISPDGTTWTMVGTTQTISTITAAAYAGLAVSSNSSSGPTCTATFDHVKLTQP